MRKIYDGLEAGFEIYGLNSSKKYYFETTTNSGIDMVNMKKNENRLELRNFGKMPYVYYSGHTNYRTFELTTIFTDLEKGDFECDGIDGEVEVFVNKTCREQVDEFKALLMERKPLIVYNTQDQYFVCDVELIDEISPKQHLLTDTLNYIEITVKCTEIADFFNKIIVRHSGNGAGDTNVRINPYGSTLGSGSGGKEVSYEIVAHYGEEISLNAVATDGFFHRWKVGRATIKTPLEFTDFYDGMVIEAEFHKEVNLNVQHVGEGGGNTSISQKGESLGSGSGGSGTSYTIRPLEIYPIDMSAEGNNTSEFKGWEDASGNPISNPHSDFKEGDTIYARFEIKKSTVRIRYLEDQTNIPLQLDKIRTNQSGNVTFSGDEISGYTLLAPTTQTVEIQGQNEYIITFYYKKNSVGIKIQHKGTASGTTKAIQNGVMLGEKTGTGVSYDIIIEPDLVLGLEANVSDDQGGYAKFIGFEYEDGTPFYNNSLVTEGTVVIYAIFDFDFGHDFNWLFILHWDTSLVGERRVDLDMWGGVHGGDLDGKFVYYGTAEVGDDGVNRKKISQGDASIELDIDNVRNGDYGTTPEVMTVLNKIGDRVSIRVDVYAGFVHMPNAPTSSTKIEVYKKGNKFNEHVKDYIIPNNKLATQMAAYLVCEVDLNSNTLIDKEVSIPAATAL